MADASPISLTQNAIRECRDRSKLSARSQHARSSSRAMAHGNSSAAPPEGVFSPAILTGAEP
jgi:hypothetical protein